jgi:outer membrane receptor for ferrienterochelin and colicin
MGLCATGSLLAQGSFDPSKGTIAVEVLDSSGAVIQNARVSLSGPTGTQKATADVRGQANFYNLIPGEYSVRAEFEGFRAAEIQRIPISASQRTSIQAKLEPGAVTETVQVTENAAKVDTTSTTTGANITSETMTNLPVARNIASLMTLSPGVADGGGTGVSNPSISGASGLENQYVIDGVNATDSGYGAFGVWSTQYGSMGMGVNFDFVKEVQVKSGGFEAQYGQATGGIVNIVTNSGGNALHGALYTYFTPGWAEGTYDQPNDLRTSELLSETHGRHATDFGFNVGGRIIRDKLFWYGSFNPSFSTVNRMAPSSMALRSLGTLPDDTRSYNWVGKVNYDINQNHHLEGTSFGDPSNVPMGFHRTLVRNSTDTDSNSKLEYGTRNWAVKYNGLFGPNTLFNGQFAWNHTSFIETPLTNKYSVRDYTQPTDTSAYTVTGGLGHLQNNLGDSKQWSFMFTRNLNLLGQQHQLDLGYSYNDVKYDNLSYYTGDNFTLPEGLGIPSDMVGTTVYGGFFYEYANRSVGGVTYPIAYRLVRGNYSEPAVSTKTAYHTAFAQDAWEINRHITAKLGVRWEEQRLQGNLSTYSFTGNWAPRLGFIIDPKGDRKTKVFANWGRFYEKIPQDMAVRAMSGEMAYMNGYYSALPPTQSSYITTSTFSPYNTVQTVIAAGTKAAYQQEIVAGIEHEFADGIIVSARFIHRDLKRILEDISGTTVEANLVGVVQQSAIANPTSTLDIFHNPVACTSGANCDTSINYTYDSGTLGSDGIPDSYPDARRIYKAFETRVEKRFANNWSIMGSYRLAKLFGNYEGLFRNDNDQADPGITSLFDFMASPALADQFKVGVLPTDRRHIANIYGNYVIKSRLNVGLGWNVQSGSPISALDAHPDYANAGEIPVGGRGAYGRSPSQNYTDMQLDYKIPLGEQKRLRVAANLFNVFNQKTTTEVDQDHQLAGGDPNGDFLKATKYHRPFYARFSVRFEF